MHTGIMYSDFQTWQIGHTPHVQLEKKRIAYCIYTIVFTLITVI